MSSVKLIAVLFCRSETYATQKVAVDDYLSSLGVSYQNDTRVVQRNGYQTCLFELESHHDRAPTLGRMLSDWGATRDLDICTLRPKQFQCDYGLACFDMDSTLIKTEVIDELAKRAGVGAQVAAITLSAMRGEIDFKQSFAKRLSLLNGLPESVIADIANELPIMDGTADMFAALQARGIKTAILSGGFSYFAERLKSMFKIDYVFANELEVRSGALTGRAIEPIVDGEFKAQKLVALARELEISNDQVIAVGDGANDLPMLAKAGLGVAFHAKPVVQERAEFALNIPGLEGLIDLLKPC